MLSDLIAPRKLSRALVCSGHDVRARSSFGLCSYRGGDGLCSTRHQRLVRELLQEKLFFETANDISSPWDSVRLSRFSRGGIQPWSMLLSSLRRHAHSSQTLSPSPLPIILFILSRAPMRLESRHIFGRVLSLLF